MGSPGVPRCRHRSALASATVPCTGCDVLFVGLEAWWPDIGIPKQRICPASPPPSKVVQPKSAGWYLLPAAEQKRHHAQPSTWIFWQGSHGKSLAGDCALKNFMCLKEVFCLGSCLLVCFKIASWDLIKLGTGSWAVLNSGTQTGVGVQVYPVRCILLLISAFVPQCFLFNELTSWSCGY